MWEECKFTMQTILDQHTPCQTKRVHNKPSFWINSELKCEMFSINLLKKKATKSNSLHFKGKRNAVNELVRKTIKCYYQSEIKNNLGNPKGKWKVLNNLMGKRTKGTELNKINITPSESIATAKYIANTLNTHFTEIGPKLASKRPSSPSSKSFKDYLTKVHSTLKKSLPLKSKNY